MRYVFKALTRRTIRIVANSESEAKREFLENYVVMNREKIEGD